MTRLFGITHEAHFSPTVKNVRLCGKIHAIFSKGTCGFLRIGKLRTDNFQTLR